MHRCSYIPKIYPVVKIEYNKRKFLRKKEYVDYLTTRMHIKDENIIYVITDMDYQLSYIKVMIIDIENPDEAYEETMTLSTIANMKTKNSKFKEYSIVADNIWITKQRETGLTEDLFCTGDLISVEQGKDSTIGTLLLIHYSDNYITILLGNPKTVDDTSRKLTFDIEGRVTYDSNHKWESKMISMRRLQN